jgi:hypothetical protein
MKTAQKITSIFLALTFLVSSLGLTANKMVCLKSGKTKLSAFSIKDCCPEKESSLPVIKSHCCDITNTFFDLGDIQKTQKVEIGQSFTVQSLFNNPLFVYNTSLASDKLTTSFADLPPPRSGRTLLSFISILII